MRKTKFKGVTDNVRPLIQREGKMDTRKGTKENKALKTSEDDSLVPDYARKYLKIAKRPPIQLPLWGNPYLQPGESETKGDLAQPDYLIKGDIA